MEQYKLCLRFLDIMKNQSPENNNIRMGIFYKKTETRRCVPFNSYHPKHCKNNIAFTLARRICTIVENDKVRKKRLQQLHKVSYSQEYLQNVIQEVTGNVTSIPI